MRQRRRTQQQSNILVFVLNSQGKYVHSFDGMTDQHPAPIHEIKKRMPGYFAEELDKAAGLMGAVATAPKKSSGLVLPTVDGFGVRIYVSLGENRLQHFRVPTVEAVSISSEERQALRYQGRSCQMDARVLQRWLAQMYPPAVMDGHGGMEKISGTLTYTPAGASKTHRFASLRGTVQFELDNRTRITYQGAFEMVLQYPSSDIEVESVAGILTSSIPRVDQRGKSVERVSMQVALETIRAARERK